jgi:hypothetical protein
MLGVDVEHDRIEISRGDDIGVRPTRERLTARSSPHRATLLKYSLSLENQDCFSASCSGSIDRPTGGEIGRSGLRDRRSFG